MTSLGSNLLRGTPNGGNTATRHLDSMLNSQRTNESREHTQIMCEYNYIYSSTSLFVPARLSDARKLHPCKRDSRYKKTCPNPNLRNGSKISIKLCSSISSDDNCLQYRTSAWASKMMCLQHHRFFKLRTFLFDLVPHLHSSGE